MEGNIMKKTKVLTALTLAATMALGSLSLTGCGSSASDENTYTWWIYSGQDSSYYSDYVENPSIQYTLNQTWGSEDKEVNLEFWVPVSGEENDNYTTMLASGDLPDIIDAVICDAPLTMYENGYTMDITEYVVNNMPNYVELVHSNDTFYKNCVTLVDGEEHYYSIRNLFDQPEDLFQGYMYRRDWIVKYGKDASTGEAFTGGYTDVADQDSWEDNVIFPSWYDEEKKAKALELDPDWDGTEPFYISDWEWMFDIFETAMADLGIEDSYCMSLYYPGFTWSGGLISCFGGGTNVWFQDENNQVQFGGDTEQMQAYLMCMNAWYEKGWLDPDFDQRTSDAFYAIDSTAVRQGLVGMWNGQQSGLGGRLDAHDGGYTDGIYVAGCAYPVNDEYGTDACKYVAPNCVMGGTTVSGGVLITTAAEGKDLDTLCAYLDYFYSEEGALVKNLGLNAEQAADYDFYSEYGLEEGTYTVQSDGTYLKSDIIINDSGNLLGAAAFNKAPGLNLIAEIDNGYADTYQASVDSWSKWQNTAFFQGTITTDNMSTDDTSTAGNTLGKVVEYMTNNAPDFIKGKKDINGSDWDSWCKALSKYGTDKMCELYQSYVDQFPFH
jgi:hypothetical protein